MKSVLVKPALSKSILRFLSGGAYAEQVSANPRRSEPI